MESEPLFWISPIPLVFRVPLGVIPGIRDIPAMLELRLGLESEAAAFAAERRTESHIEELAGR